MLPRMHRSRSPACGGVIHTRSTSRAVDICSKYHPFSQQAKLSTLPAASGVSTKKGSSQDLVRSAFAYPMDGRVRVAAAPDRRSREWCPRGRLCYSPDGIDDLSAPKPARRSDPPSSARSPLVLGLLYLQFRH
jgi:hypothetical protein